MRESLCTAFAVLLLCLVPSGARAQESLGIFNSPKGFGAEVRLPEKGRAFMSAHVFVDIYEVATSRCSYPGIRANVSRQYVLNRIEKEGVSYTLYAGPGISAGYVRDHDKGRGIDFTSLAGNNEGAMVALSGNFGCRFDFGGLISLDLSIAGDLGLHMRRNESERDFFAISTSIYNNGIYQILCPQLTILFNLR